MLGEMRIEREKYSNMTSKVNLRGSTPQHQVSFPEHLPNRSLLVRAIRRTAFSHLFLCGKGEAELGRHVIGSFACFARYAFPGGNCVLENIEFRPTRISFDASRSKVKRWVIDSKGALCVLVFSRNGSAPMSSTFLCALFSISPKQT